MMHSADMWRTTYSVEGAGINEFVVHPSLHGREKAVLVEVMGGTPNRSYFH